MCAPWWAHWGLRAGAGFLGAEAAETHQPTESWGLAGRHVWTSAVCVLWAGGPQRSQRIGATSVPKSAHSRDVSESHCWGDDAPVAHVPAPVSAPMSGFPSSPSHSCSLGSPPGGPLSPALLGGKHKEPRPQPRTTNSGLVLSQPWRPPGPDPGRCRQGLLPRGSEGEPGRASVPGPGPRAIPGLPWLWPRHRSPAGRILAQLLLSPRGVRPVLFPKGHLSLV